MNDIVDETFYWFNIFLLTTITHEFGLFMGVVGRNGAMKIVTGMMILPRLTLLLLKSLLYTNCNCSFDKVLSKMALTIYSLS